MHANLDEQILKQRQLIIEMDQHYKKQMDSLCSRIQCVEERIARISSSNPNSNSKPDEPHTKKVAPPPTLNENGAHRNIFNRRERLPNLKTS